MAEIKLNDNFRAEVNAFRAAGGEIEQMSVNAISLGDLSLPTVDAYLNRVHEIEMVLFIIQLLIEKDAKDMDALAESLRATDTNGC